VALWPAKILNIHPSLLPRYKGLDTHERALAAGDQIAGCSVHVVTAELDDGEVLAQTEVPVFADDTPDTLASRVLIAEHQTYAPAISAYIRQFKG
jgi:phosphoribosylglycinamide formyltransferase-1